ncbi:hypothetical protein NC651_039891 [Populus alba x Populus x berolinensis]|nr:hypothetical protein NC651_039891 [Populus alba x Populus x berolinensis]
MASLNSSASSSQCPSIGDHPTDSAGSERNCDCQRKRQGKAIVNTKPAASSYVPGQSRPPLSCPTKRFPSPLATITPQAGYCSAPLTGSAPGFLSVRLVDGYFGMGFQHHGSLAGAHDFDLFKKAPDCTIWMGAHCKNSKHVASSQTLIGGLAILLPFLWASTLIMGKVSLCSDFKARVSSSVMLSSWVINGKLALT